ncbi:DUF429 domain-containing protein [Micrococcoides hystricis]|uniref:DUF429 domain-containing protein n=1 Tax=Micrococcoides hystricis TaxID=1572761 RepID=A0ABV6PCV1_9MICC
MATDSEGSSIFGGVDLAAESGKTAAATILEDASGVSIVDVRIGVDDDSIVDLVAGAVTTGMDVPVGWPADFVKLVSAHAREEQDVPVSTDRAWRRGLALRATDRFVHEHIGGYPLSVAADLIAYPAFRWAGIEARLRGAGVDVARDGTGKICEVYPAGALRVWGLPSRGYKSDRNTAVRETIVDGLSAKMPWLDWGGFAQRCVQNDDALDAVIAALVARQVHHGEAVAPPAELAGLARQEGWIWLPVQEAEIK